METPQNVAATKEFLVTGVSRSGRVRKKSSKLLDFQSPDEVEKKPKRALKSGRISSSRGRLSATNARGRRVFDGVNTIGDVVEDDDELFDDLDESEELLGDKTIDGSLGDPDSDDELDELVADIVEGVEAESIENSNNNIESKVRQSLYMTEKSNKRKILKDGKVVTGKLERKDKGKSRYTAYSMWAREFRKTSKFSKNHDLDFTNAARRLGELWANVSNKEKNAWRRKAKIQATKAKAREKSVNTVVSTVPTVSTANASFFNRATTSRTKKLAAERQKTPPLTATTNVLKTAAMLSARRKRNNSYKSVTTSITPSSSPSTNANANSKLHLNSNQVLTTNNTSSHSNHSTVPHKKAALPSIEAIDAAAHLKLLGESLTIIGERLKEHEGQIAVSGSLSVLLDSLLCSLGPLLCLTTHIPGLEKKTQLSENLANTLDNIAYVMPGL